MFAMFFDKVNVIGHIAWSAFLFLGVLLVLDQPPLLRISAALYIIGSVLDLVSTKIALTKPNVVETNPIVVKLGFGLSELVFFALVLLVAMILQGSAQIEAESLSSALAILAFSRFGAAGNNFIVIAFASKEIRIERTQTLGDGKGVGE